MTTGPNGPDLAQLASHLLHARAPVVVTFGAAGALAEVHGDLDFFVGEGGSRESLLAMLQDLLVGRDAGVNVLDAVETTPGHYADIHLVAEGEVVHVVLLDATDALREKRQLQQVGNEAMLAEQRLQREVNKHDAAESFYEAFEVDSSQNAELIEALSIEFRGRLSALIGKTQLLEDQTDPGTAAARTLLSIRQAAVCLDVLAANYADSLRSNLGGEFTEPEHISLEQVSSELQRLFGSSELDPRLAYEIVVEPGATSSVELEHPKALQVIVTLIALALEIPGITRVCTTLGASEEGFFAQLDLAASVPFSPAGGLLDNTAIGMAVCRRLIRAMEGRLIVVPGVGTACPSIRVEIPRPAPAAPIAAAEAGTTNRPVVVAVNDARARDKMRSVLAELHTPCLLAEGQQHLEQIAKQSGVAMVVLSDPFDGVSAPSLVYRLHEAGIRCKTLLLSSKSGDFGDVGWLHTRQRFVVPMSASREDVLEVMSAALDRHGEERQA